VIQHLPPTGSYLLDGGSGPIQYSEYLEYSHGYRHRVCLDISHLALREARSRIGDHGLYVVGDISKLPFKADVFEGVVSMHVVYHLPREEQASTFREFFRVLRPSGKGVIVYSWGEHSTLMRLARFPMWIASKLIKVYNRVRHGRQPIKGTQGPRKDTEDLKVVQAPSLFSFKYDYQWLRQQAGHLPGFDVHVWRTASSAFLRAFIFKPLFGQFWLRILYWVEERAPRLMGRVGQYPMVLFEKPPAHRQQSVGH
jgi:SAM-dependent methyltransferase